MDDQQISTFSRHADRSFVLLLWAGLVGVLFYGCGNDSSLQLTTNVSIPRVRLAISSTAGGSGSLVDVSDRTLIAGEGMTELTYNRGSAVVLKPKTARGSKFTGWKIEPESAATQVNDDGRLLISDLRNDVLIEAVFEKIVNVTFQVRFKNEKSPERTNLVRWNYFLPENTTDTPDGYAYCPDGVEEMKTLSCKPKTYPFGTRIEMTSGSDIAPNHDGARFTLEKELNVLEYTLGPYFYR